MDSTTTEESHSQLYNTISNIAYDSPEDVLAGALLAVVQYARDHKLSDRAITALLIGAQRKAV